MIRKTQTRIGGSLVIAVLPAAGATFAADTLDPAEAANYVGDPGQIRLMAD